MLGGVRECGPKDGGMRGKFGVEESHMGGLVSHGGMSKMDQNV